MIMSPQSKKEYIEAIHSRYKNASRQEKTVILDEFCVTYRCHRKHAIRVLNKFKRFTKPKSKKKRGKRPVYQDEEIRNPLKKIWLASNAPMESFFHTLKTEWVYGLKYKTCQEAKASLFEYIEIFYNRQRRYSALKYMKPCQYELYRMAA
jgi:Integrase core domain